MQPETATRNSLPYCCRRCEFASASCGKRIVWLQNAGLCHWIKSCDRRSACYLDVSQPLPLIVYETAGTPTRRWPSPPLACRRRWRLRICHPGRDSPPRPFLARQLLPLAPPPAPPSLGAGSRKGRQQRRTACRAATLTNRLAKKTRRLQGRKAAAARTRRWVMIQGHRSDER